MAYFSLHAYDADVWIPAFLGLRQQDESLNTDVRFATDVLNVETPNGVLQPHAGWDTMTGEFEHKVETIARFYRRWYSGNGSKHWLLCAENGKLYYRQEGADDIGWVAVRRGSGATPFSCNVWSWCTYEIPADNEEDPPIDVMLMSNAEDGMIMVIPPDRPSIWSDYSEFTWNDFASMTWEEVYSPAWTISTVNTNGYKFGIIERYAERVFGAAIPGDPDMIWYSRPYSPTDWTLASNSEQPADGAGSIQQPSWDGDSFTALRRFGDYLIAFKEHKLWRISSSYDTDVPFVMAEQYGRGAPFFNTIAVDVERIFMTDIDGISVYDGMSVSPFNRELIEKLWRRVNKDALDQMCAALFDNRYYLSVPLDDATENNALIVYNLHDNTILFYDDIKVESMLSTPEKIYMTTSDTPGKVHILNYDSWVAKKASGGATKWVSPWMDFGYKRIQKGGFDLYFTPEVQDEPVTLKISIQTEKKTKSKEYTIQPLTEAQRTANKEHRNKKLHFGGSGRRFRLIIESDEGNVYPWRLIGGIQLVVETDPD